jgi:hypothetical protein
VRLLRGRRARSSAAAISRLPAGPLDAFRPEPEARAIVASDPAKKALFFCLTALGEVCLVLARTLIANTPKLGSLSRHCRRVRNVLCVPTLSAVHCNLLINESYRRLSAARRPKWLGWPARARCL